MCFNANMNINVIYIKSTWIIYLKRKDFVHFNQRNLYTYFEEKVLIEGLLIIKIGSNKIMILNTSY